MEIKSNFAFQHVLFKGIASQRGLGQGWHISKFKVEFYGIFSSAFIFIFFKAFAAINDLIPSKTGMALVPILFHGNSVLASGFVLMSTCIGYP